jgi:rRNA-processing protein FCF1
MGGFGLSKANPTQFMIMDACVLIDYMNGEPDLFKLISSHIGPIYVATPILEEVDSINSIDELEDLGLIPIEPEIEDVFTADVMDGQTSFQDNICFLTARRQGFTCVSNDKNLRRQCTNASIPILWGLELILDLTKAGGLLKKEASKIARDIQKSNPRHISARILSDFEAKLKRL